ncbi:MAG: AAA family ATPase [Candidatus Marsarchaeota archaeon]|nr:AAA family ATPase [Candidatus Marsarchaeota archaeon]MCL5106018.1 AAA family ATPase [Candidatus Marsarchaeota archaeon]
MANENQASYSEEAIKGVFKLPLFFYMVKDKAIAITSNQNFFDAVLLCFAFLIDAIVFKFYPVAAIIALILAIGVLTLKNAFLGLIALVVLIFPTMMYQSPGIAWVMLFAISIVFFTGYQHYRTITFIFLLAMLALSPLGFMLEIPVYIIAILMLGYKRGMLMTVGAVLLIVALGGAMGMHNTGYIITGGAEGLPSSSVSNMTVPNQPSPTIFSFGSAIPAAIKRFASPNVAFEITGVINLFFKSLAQSAYYLVQLGVLLAVAFGIDAFAYGNRSKLNGMEASFIGIGYPLSFLLVSAMNGSLSSGSMLSLVSFFIAPLVLYVFAVYNIDIVKVLEVRKQDLRMKFGEAFEELEVGKTNERLEDVANYDTVKAELKDAIVGPIEERGISRAYNVEPSKGIVFFGPPGTGKTMMMRALANEIHAGFYYVKASNLISSYPGETEKKIAQIFSIARKHAPCILFFDEIDSIGMSRENVIDDIHRQALTQLLIELDGFQKITNIVVVGATNIPESLDPALLRPGRFDKLIYMPLPEISGRRLIFKMYLGKLPISGNVDINELARKTERFSGADIKNVCESVAQMVAQKASKSHAILQITQKDILDVLAAIRASTSLADIEKYNKFKLMFERTIYGIAKEEENVEIPVIGLDDVKKAVNESVEIPMKYPEMVKKYGIKPVNGILLFGPPGNGKTMMMRQISKGIKGVTMIELDTASILKMGSQEALEKIKEEFNLARENAPSIIFMDEIDGVFPKRDISSSQEFVQMTSELLKQIDGIKSFSDIVIIAATNRPDSLDPALLRPGRFDKLIFVKPPEANDRIALFKQNLANIGLADDVNFDKIGRDTNGFTGADIANVCRQIKINALKKNINENKEISISMQDIETIVKKTRPSASEIVVSQFLSFLSKYGER